MNIEESFTTCLKVISNRCRNVKKAIERGKTWEKAAKEGHVLNEGQLESINSLWKKEAILAELEEILKKQTSIAKEAINANKKSSGGNHNNKDLHISSADNTTEKSESNSNLESETPSNPTVESVENQIEPINENELLNHENVSEDNSTDKIIDNHLDMVTDNIHMESNQTSDSQVTDMAKLNGIMEQTATSDKGESSLTPSLDTDKIIQEKEDMQKKVEIIEKKMIENEIKHNQQLTSEKMKLTRSILNIFHIGEFCRQEGSREALLAYYQSESGRKSGRTLTNLDVDLFCYFHTMLTTPNGVVPHNEAVGVSTTHCLNLINQEPLEAFKGTTYSKLVSVIDTISTCPILTERGKTPSRNGPRRGRGGYGRGRGRDRQKSMTVNSNTPNHHIRDAAALSEPHRTS